jgi:SNF2 family DNA or RNA helicase
VDKFSDNPKYSLLIGQVLAAGVGLNIVAADTVAMVEEPYCGSDVEQAFGRVDRITLKSRSVSLYHLPGVGTVDVDICMLLEEKQRMLEVVLDNGEKSDILGEDITLQLMKAYAKKGEK